jgi:hypothetical protein
VIVEFPDGTVGVLDLFVVVDKIDEIDRSRDCAVRGCVSYGRFVVGPSTGVVDCNDEDDV